jgi:hypothetical protein
MPLDSPSTRPVARCVPSASVLGAAPQLTPHNRCVYFDLTAAFEKNMFDVVGAMKQLGLA